MLSSGGSVWQNCISSRMKKNKKEEGRGETSADFTSRDGREGTSLSSGSSTLDLSGGATQ